MGVLYSVYSNKKSLCFLGPSLLKFYWKNTYFIWVRKYTHGDEGDTQTTDHTTN